MEGNKGIGEKEGKGKWERKWKVEGGVPIVTSIASKN